MTAGELTRQARTIAVLTAASRVAGFARTLVFAATVGATAVGSIYQSTNTVPNVIYEVAAGGILAAATVPLLAGRAAANDRAGTSAVASALLTWSLVILAPLTLLVLLLARPIAGALLDPGALGADAVDRGALMLTVFAPQILLYGWGIVLSGVLQAHRRFAAAAAAPLVSSLVVIGTYAAYGLLCPDPGHPTRQALNVLAWGTTAGVLAMLLTLLPSLAGLGLSWRPRLRFPPGVAARALHLAGAGLLALVAQQVAVLAVVWLSNHRGGPGVLIAYQYAQALYLLPYAVLAVPIATAAFPVLAAAVSETKPPARVGTDREGLPGAAPDGAAGVLARSLRSILIVTTAGAAALVAAAPDLGGFFSALDRSRSGSGGGALAALPAALTSMSPGLVGFGAAALLVRALYARGPARRAAGAMAVGWLVAAGLPILTTLGHNGIRSTLIAVGVGSTTGMTIAALVLAVLVWRAWGPPGLAGAARTLLTVAIAAVGSTLLLRWGVGRWWTAPGGGVVGHLVHGLVVGLVPAAVVLAAGRAVSRTSRLSGTTGGPG